MKVFLIVAFIALAGAKPKNNALPEIRVNLERSALTNLPEIDITFANGHQDSMVLNQFYSSEEERMARKESCNYFGHLENDPSACVAVTGCIGVDDLEMTINSKHTELTNMYILHKDGTLEAVESTFKDPKVFTDYLVAPKQDDGENPEEPPPMMPMVSSRALPTTNLMKIKIGYDDSFRNSFGSTAEVETYLNAMVAHVQAHYCLDSLGTKVQVERVGDLTHHVGQTWRAESDSGSLSGPVKSLTEQSTSDANLHVYMCRDPQFYGVVGVAWLGTLCRNYWKGYQASINEKRSSTLTTAEVVTHELGHNLGMYHDFDSVHNGKGCDGTGFMSYGSHPYQWSTCSQQDFESLYNSLGGSWCLPSAPTACGLTGTEPTTPATTPPSGACAAMATHPNWYQDKYCDDMFNSPECGYDGGDCCLKKRSNWNAFCSQCECLGLDCPQYTNWWRDRYCDDFLNTAGCFYDGGDCCPPHSTSYWSYFCDTCACLDTLA